MHASARSTARRKRFRRDRTADAIQMTHRDLTILQALHRHRFLDSDLVSALPNAGSGQHLRRRLRRLYDQGYVDRPRAQISQCVFGNRPMIYALADRGLDQLADIGLSSGPSRRLSDLNREIGFAHIDHALGLARVTLALETALKAAPITDIIQPASEQTQWAVEIAWPALSNEPVKTTIKRVKIIPDAQLVWTVGGASEPKTIFVEYDRGTEPIVRKTAETSSILRKLLAYTSLHNRRPEHLPNFRVLFVTTSAARTASMQEAYAQYIGSSSPAGLFAFAPEAEALSAPLGPVWRDGKDRAVSLV